MIVYIGDTTGGVPIEDWGVRAFKAWGVGRKGIDDGIALFIMARDRKIHIEVGYGLEAVLPDAMASRIIRETIVPAIQSGNNDAAITGAVNRILATLSGEPLKAEQEGTISQQNQQQQQQQQQQHQRRPHGQSLIQMIFFAFIAIFFLFMLITHPYLTIQFLMMVMASGRGSGGGGGGFDGGGGGGGFSGGGGRSGGGGASGSW